MLIGFFLVRACRHGNGDLVNRYVHGSDDWMKSSGRSRAKGLWPRP